MRNRNSREFVIKQADEAAWTLATTQPRLAVADVHARGIGIRRLQLIVCPSFEEAKAWEVRQFEDEWRLFRSEVISNSPALELIGYYRLSIAPDVLASFFSRIVSLSLPISPRLDDMGGLDGEICQLAVFGGLYSELRFQWWSEPPEAWLPLVAIATEMFEAFSAAKPINLG